MTVSGGFRPTAITASPTAVTAKPRAPETIALSPESVRTLRLGAETAASSADTYAADAQAALARIAAMRGAPSGRSLAVNEALAADPNTSGFAAELRPLYDMVGDTPGAADTLTAAIGDALTMTGQRNGTALVAEAATARMKLDAITATLIAPERQGEVGAILDIVVGQLAATVTADPGLLSQAMTMVGQVRTGDAKADQVYAMIDTALDRAPASPLNAAERDQLAGIRQGFAAFRQRFGLDAA